VIGELPKKKRKKKKKKSASKPRQQSVFDFVKKTQPYQIPLYMPPFPATMPSQRIDNHVRVENLLRNYISVNKQELNRLKGDLTAYRQEAETAFKKNVAYPRATVDLGSFGGASIDDDTNSVISSSSGTTAAEPDSDYTPSASSASSISFGKAEGLVADIGRMIGELNVGSESDTPSELFRKAGEGAGRLTEPEMTDISDLEGLTSGTSVGRGAGGGFKKVSFGEPMDLTEPESDFAPRASQQQRASRRTRVYVDNASNRRLGRVGKSY